MAEYSKTSRSIIAALLSGTKGLQVEREDGARWKVENGILLFQTGRERDWVPGPVPTDGYWYHIIDTPAPEKAATLDELKVLLEQSTFKTNVKVTYAFAGELRDYIFQRGTHWAVSELAAMVACIQLGGTVEVVE